MKFVDNIGKVKELAIIRYFWGYNCDGFMPSRINHEVVVCMYPATGSWA